MEVQLALVLTLSVHLGHLFQGLEHGLDDSVVSGIHRTPYLQRISTEELVLNETNVHREVFDEMDHALPFLAGQLCLLDTLDLLVLKNIRGGSYRIEHSLQYVARKGSSAACAVCPAH